VFSQTRAPNGVAKYYYYKNGVSFDI